MLKVLINFLATEEQALDRVHRMGQEKKVIAIRYIVDQSIEQVRSSELVPVTSY